MGYDFTSDEIFEMAEQIERNGAKFYRTAAEGIEDLASKDLLLDLASMEDEHEKIFSLLREKLAEKDKGSTVFDPDDESVFYLRSLADTHIFSKKEIPDISSIKEILKSAIAAEKDSVIFFLSMRDLVPENLGKNKLDDIIKEEMEHIRILGKKLALFK